MALKFRALGNTKLGAMRAVIFGKLFLGGENGLFVTQNELRFVSADADGIRGRTGAALGKIGKGVLCGSVLKRMEGDHGDPAAGG